MSDAITFGLFVCGNEYARGPFTAKFNDVGIKAPMRTMFKSPVFIPGALRIKKRGDSVMILGLKDGNLSKINIYDSNGRSLFTVTTTQRAICSLPLSRRGSGMHIISITGASTACVKWVKLH